MYPHQNKDGGSDTSTPPDLEDTVPRGDHQDELLPNKIQRAQVERLNPLDWPQMADAMLQVVTQLVMVERGAGRFKHPLRGGDLVRLQKKSPTVDELPEGGVDCGSIRMLASSPGTACQLFCEPTAFVLTPARHRRQVSLWENVSRNNEL